jgi:hypothetical protein
VFCLSMGPKQRQFAQKNQHKQHLLFPHHNIPLSISHSLSTPITHTLPCVPHPAGSCVIGRRGQSSYFACKRAQAFRGRRVAAERAAERNAEHALASRYMPPSNL